MGTLEISEPMEAKHDAIVTDAAGLTRKIFAGQRVPVELEGAYRESFKDEPDKAKAETAPEVHKMEDGPEVSKATKPKRTRK